MGLKETVKTYNEARAQFMATAKGELKEEFKKLFEAHPVIQSIQWEQYTPYFNDGDPCEFSVGDAAVLPEGDEDRTEWWYIKEHSKRELLEAAKAYWDENIADAFSNKELMEGMFGDHVQITATPAGFDVEEYDHD